MKGKQRETFHIRLNILQTLSDGKEYTNWEICRTVRIAGPYMLKYLEKFEKINLVTSDVYKDAVRFRITSYGIEIKKKLEEINEYLQKIGLLE